VNENKVEELFGQANVLVLAYPASHPSFSSVAVLRMPALLGLHRAVLKAHTHKR
jgi:hypothetical protein